MNLGMNITRYGGSLVRKVLARSGFELVRKTCVGASTLSSSLSRLAERNVVINSVIDIGASNGSWSAELMKHYPTANYLLIEAQAVHEPKLKQFCGQHSNAQYILAAAGAEESEIFFDASDPFGGLASYHRVNDNFIRVRMTTVDSQLKKYNLAPPYLLKLDTHGFEIPIFNGAAECLSQASVLVVECYNFKIAPEALLFHEMCAYLERSGFRCIDMCDLLYRPADKAFWQMDILFMNAGRSEFSYLEFD